MIKKYLLLFSLLISQKTFGNFTDVTFGTGLISEFISTYQVDTSGNSNGIDPRVYFNLGGEYQFSTSWSLLPEAGLLWPFGTTEADYTHKYSYFFNLPLGYRFNEWFLARFGAGYYITTIKGDGKTASLPNGDGYTSFPVAKGSSTAHNIITILGVEFLIPDTSWSLKLESFTFNPFASADRSFSTMIAFQYHFGDYFWK